MNRFLLLTLAVSLSTLNIYQVTATETVDLEYGKNSVWNTDVSFTQQIKEAETLNRKYVGIINRQISLGIPSPLEQVYYLTPEINKAFVGASIFEDWGFVVKNGKFYGTTSEVRYCSFIEYQGLCAEYKDPKYITYWYYEKLEGFPLLKEISYDSLEGVYKLNIPSIKELMPGSYVIENELYSESNSYFGPYEDITIGFEKGVWTEENPYSNYQWKVINKSTGTGILPRFKEDHIFNY